MERIPMAFVRSARGKLKKVVRNKPLNSTQQRNVDNAMETFDDLMADRNLNKYNSDIAGDSKPSALIGNKRMNRAIQRIGEGKTQTQTDAVNALLQGAGVGFAVGYDSTRDKKPVKKTKTKAPIPKKKPSRKKPPMPKPKPSRKKTPVPKKKPSLRTRLNLD